MAKNMTNVHKKLDRLIQKLGTLDEIKNEQREIRLQTRYLAQMAGASVQLLQEARRATDRLAEMQSDIAVMAREALRESREANERIAELLATGRKH